jgi:hypothetical protein
MSACCVTTRGSGDVVVWGSPETYAAGRGLGVCRAWRCPCGQGLGAVLSWVGWVVLCSGSTRQWRRPTCGSLELLHPDDRCSGSLVSLGSFSRTRERLPRLREGRWWVVFFLFWRKSEWWGPWVDCLRAVRRRSSAEGGFGGFAGRGVRAVRVQHTFGGERPGGNHLRRDERERFNGLPARGVMLSMSGTGYA